MWIRFLFNPRAWLIDFIIDNVLLFKRIHFYIIFDISLGANYLHSKF